MTEADPLELFDPAYSIQQNCLHAEGIGTPKIPGVSFSLDCCHHAIFAVRQWPRRTFPGIISALTSMGFQEYGVTMNIYPKRIDKVIESEERNIQRLQIDAMSERKQSLATDMAAKQDKVNELQQGRPIPLDCLYVVRLLHPDPKLLPAPCPSPKNPFISIEGSTIPPPIIPENSPPPFL